MINSIKIISLLQKGQVRKKIFSTETKGQQNRHQKRAIYFVRESELQKQMLFCTTSMSGKHTSMPKEGEHFPSR